jgi:hypothetical protein
MIKDKSDRHSSRELWLEELKRINFEIDEPEIDYPEYNSDDYSEESYP